MDVKSRAVRTQPTYIKAVASNSDETPNIPTMPSKAKLCEGMREAELPISSPLIAVREKWKTFAAMENYSGEPNGKGVRLANPTVRISFSDLEDIEERVEEDEKIDQGLFSMRNRRRKVWYKRTQTVLLNNPMVPLAFRACTWVLSLLSLALAISVFTLSKTINFPQNAGTYMAITVSTVALCYLIYITFDEYSSQPLGLRSPKAKMRLILLDVLFISFAAANLALAFDAVFQRDSACRSVNVYDPFSTPKVGSLCQRLKALSALIILTLGAWLISFSVSVFRLVERVSR